MTIGVVLGSFAPLHKGHMDLIYESKKKQDKTIVAVCGYAGDKGDQVGIPFPKRVQIITDFFKYDSLMDVVAMNDDLIGIAGYCDKWDEWLAAFTKEAHLHSLDGTVWYTGENKYADELERRGLEVNRADRQLNPISATMIRNNPIKYWGNIAKPFRKEFQKRILIIGTASEGKTNLTQDIANYFGIPYSKEYGHEWQLEKVAKGTYSSDRELNISDFKEFLDMQHKWNESTDHSKVIICDSDAVTTLLYAKCYADDPEFGLSKEEYNVLHAKAILDGYIRRWDKIFLLPPKGNSFVADGAREMQYASYDERKYQYDILIDLMREFNYIQNTEVLFGDYYSNFIKVKNYINNLLGIELVKEGAK